MNSRWVVVFGLLAACESAPYADSFTPSPCDVSTEGGGQGGDARVVDTCSSSADCDDGDPCTADECYVSHCRHIDVRGCGAACTDESESCVDATTTAPCCRRGTPGTCLPVVHACAYCVDTSCYLLD